MSATASGRGERLDTVLAGLLRSVPEVEAAAVVSFDGLPMASALPAGMDEGRVAAMSAALLGLGERAAEGLGRGELSQVFIEGADGTVFLVSADNEAVLVAVVTAGAKVGLMLFEVKLAAAAVAEVLRQEPDPVAVAAVAPPAAAVAHPVAPAAPPVAPVAPVAPVVAAVPAQAAPVPAPAAVPAWAVPAPAAVGSVLPSDPPRWS